MPEGALPARGERLRATRVRDEEGSGRGDVGGFDYGEVEEVRSAHTYTVHCAISAPLAQVDRSRHLPSIATSGPLCPWRVVTDGGNDTLCSHLSAAGRGRGEW